MLTLNYRDTKPIYIQIKSGLKKLIDHRRDRREMKKLPLSGS